MFSQTFHWKSQNKEIKVTVIFPEERDKKTEQDFLGYLKELYMSKITDKELRNPYCFPIPYDRQAKREKPQ